MAKVTQYETYRLNRVVSIHAIVSADHLTDVYTSFTAHFHAHAWELCHCIAGQMAVQQDGQMFSLSPGQCLLIPPEVSHKVFTYTADSQAIVLSFTCMDAYLSILRGRTVGTNERQQQRFQEILLELRSAFDLEKDQVRISRFRPSQHSPLGAEQLICCYLEEILIEMLRGVIQQADTGAGHADLEAAVQSFLAGQVTAYIRSHLGEELSVEGISQHFHYSRNRMGILYKAATGNSLGRAITLERISRAKELLAAEEKSVTEISGELGFSSPQYFSKKFTAEVGCPPSQYAKTVLDTP